jgi:4'-phosphopantetheinyl transferase
MSALYPVIMAVPEAVSGLPRAAKQRALSRYARTPLAVSANKAGLILPVVLEKDRRGAPLPAGGLWWSVTHKSGFVAGIVSSEKIGIDIEKIGPFSPALLKKVVSPEEQGLFDGDEPTMLFRCWTAKEAVLKAEGRGLAGLSQCRVEAVVSDTVLAVVFGNHHWIVEQQFFNGHVAAVVKNEDDRVFWTLLDADEKEMPLDNVRG